MTASSMTLFWTCCLLWVSIATCQTTSGSSSCGQNTGCLHYPTSCVPGNFPGNCLAILTWKPSNDPNYIIFSLTVVNNQAYQIGWVAFGLSQDTLMGADSVTDCILQDNGTVNVGFSYNVVASPIPYNVPYQTNSTSMLKSPTGTYNNGILSCTFWRSIKGDNNGVFDLNNFYYLFLGFGQASAGVKQQHKIDPQVSAFPVSVASNFLDVSNPVTQPPTPPPLPPSQSVFPCTQPNDCIYDGNGNQVTFVPMAANVLINMTSTVVGSSGWLSLGFSNDQIMADDSVVDCILAMNGTIIVKHSYNNYHYNVDISGATEGIVVQNTSNVNGVLTCLLIRTISNFRNDQIFALTKPYYLFLAHGPVNSQAIKQVHFAKYFTPYAIDITEDFAVPRVKSYFADGIGNWASFAYLSDTNEIQFELNGIINGSGNWVALGFSEDTDMGGDCVLDCIMLQNGSVVVRHSYNVGGSGPNGEDILYNVPLNTTEGITVISTSSQNGIFSCVFKQTIYGLHDQVTCYLNQSYYLFLGKGPVDANGVKQQHYQIPAISSDETDVRMTGNVTMQQPMPMSTPNMPMSTPNAVVPAGVSIFQDTVGKNEVQFQLSSDGNSVKFVISGPAPQSNWWIAVGFSKDKSMGDDSVLDCIHLSNGSFKVQNSYNLPGQNNEIQNSGEGISGVDTSYANGMMSCTLNRNILGFQNLQIFPFNQTYYLLLASGPVDSNGLKEIHRSNVNSPQQYNLTSGTNQKSLSSGRRYSNAPDPPRLLRAHGVLMLTAFVMLMSGAIILARYYKTCWPEDKICGTAVWFAVHRFLNVIGLFCCAAGFILIFCYSDGQVWRNFSTGSPSYFWVHGPLGIIVMILIIVNPVIAIFRCDPDHDMRWIFNWMHWFVGTCCQIIAGINLFFGIKMGEQYKVNHFSVFWILIAFVGFHCFIEFILIIEKIITQRHTRKSFTVNYALGGAGDEPTPVKEGTAVPTQESLMFRYFVLALYTSITMGLWLAMIILLGGSFYVS